jgi:hypothetical protein
LGVLTGLRVNEREGGVNAILGKNRGFVVLVAGGEGVGE